MRNRKGTRILTLATLTSLLLPVLISQQAGAVQAGPDYAYTVTPCRIVDTRQAVGSFAGPLQPGEKMDVRTWGTTVFNQGGSPTNCPDIPADATGIYINVIAANPTGNVNWFSVKPYGTPDNSTAVNYGPNSGAIGNSQLAATCEGQWHWGPQQGPYPCDSWDLTFENGPNGSADLIVDVTGYTRWY